MDINFYREKNNTLILQSDYADVIKDLRKINVDLPKNPTSIEVNLQSFSYPTNGQLVTPVEEIKAVNLNPNKGIMKLKSDRLIAGYDESINKFDSLEGTAYLTAHSLVLTEAEDYYPTGLLAFYFYTKSKEIIEKTKSLRYSKDSEMDSKKDYIKDKLTLLTQYTPDNSILFIDGPLIGGDVYTYMIRAIDQFLLRDIIPVFFVKNSTSNLVSDNIKEITHRYNSDMHWAYKFLKKGQRSNFFKYVDGKNPNNAKVFCYLKTFEISPQRIEFHIDAFEKYRDEINEIMDLIYYLILVQGQLKNPQVRPIAIAEQYAREFIHLANTKKYFNDVGLTPTVNQERFGW